MRMMTAAKSWDHPASIGSAINYAIRVGISLAGLLSLSRCCGNPNSHSGRAEIIGHTADRDGRHIAADQLRRCDRTRLTRRDALVLFLRRGTIDIHQDAANDAGRLEAHFDAAGRQRPGDEA